MSVASSLYMFFREGGVAIPLGTEKHRPCACNKPHSNSNTGVELLASLWWHRRENSSKGGKNNSNLIVVVVRILPKNEHFHLQVKYSCTNLRYGCACAVKV